MKRFYALFFILFACYAVKSQAVSYELKDLSKGTVFKSSTTFYYGIAASSRHSQVFEIKNTSSFTQIYRLTKIDVWRNVVAAGDSSYSHFCLGLQCFDSNTKTSTFTLTPGETLPLIFEMDEASVIGETYTKYEVKNTSNNSEQVLMMMRYNYPVAGINEYSASGIQFSGLYPIPASTSINFEINTHQEGIIYIQLYNSNGQEVVAFAEKINAGKNTCQVNTNALSAGTYFISASQNGLLFKQNLILEK